MRDTSIKVNIEEDFGSGATGGKRIEQFEMTGSNNYIMRITGNWSNDDVVFDWVDEEYKKSAVCPICGRSFKKEFLCKTYMKDYVHKAEVYGKQIKKSIAELQCANCGCIFISDEFDTIRESVNNAFKKVHDLNWMKG